MKKLFFYAVAAAFSLHSFAADTVTGNLKYQDFKFGLDGYTGSSQLLPVRHLKIRVVNGSGTQLGFGYTDASGNYSVTFTNPVTQTIYLLASCEGDVADGYPIYVANKLINGNTPNLSNLQFIATSIDTVPNHIPGNSANAGNSVIYAKSTVSVAQAFNIFDCGVDGFNWVASSEAKGTKATADDVLIYEWSATLEIDGGYYSNHTISMGGPAHKTSPISGYADMIVLHETGHYIDDVVLKGVSTNPGGQHFINDNYQDPRLSWGEGWPTFIAGSILKWKQANAEPISGTSPAIYVDMVNPPSWPPAPGTALSFSYDFEIGYQTQRGSANENNITSVLWDMADSPSIPDLSNGADDENLTVSMPAFWTVFKKMATLNTYLTSDDFWIQWFALNSGSDEEMKHVFNTKNHFPYFEDQSEPESNSKQTAQVLPAQDVRVPGANNGVVIYEVEVGSLDGAELMNTTESAVDISGWKFNAGLNTKSTISYTFPPNTVIGANGILRVIESGDATENKPGTVFIGANIEWNYDTNGACALVNSSGTGIDFVRWGGNTSLAIPSGTSFTGSINAPSSPNSLQRQTNGYDSNSASDFTEKLPTFGYTNAAVSFSGNTFYQENDVDYYSLKGQPGNTYTVFSEGFFSATLPEISITNSAGFTIISSAATTSTDQLSLTVVLPDTNLYFVRFTNNTPYSRFGEYTLSVLRENDNVSRPFPPADLNYSADNGIHLSWINGSTYDSVVVFRDGIKAGKTDQTFFDDTAVLPKSQHLYSLEAWKNGIPADEKPELAAINAKALDLYSNYFETATEQKFWKVEGGWGPEEGTGVGGSNALTDSPGIDYTDNTETRVELRIPVLVTSTNKLLFSHVALIEPGDQDGDWDYGKVEVRKKGSSVWIDATSLLTNSITSVEGNGKLIDGRMYASWEQELEDLTYNIPPLYKNESINLSSIPGIAVNDTVFISFRLFTDSFVTYDGWYLDNVGISDGSSLAVEENESALPERFELYSAYPNPFNPATSFRFTVGETAPASLAIYNLLGQKVNTIFSEAAEKGKVYTIIWNGKNDRNQTLSSGVYFAVLQQGNNFKTTKVTFLK